MKSVLNDSELLRLYRGFFVFGDSASLKILFELSHYGEKNFTELRSELDINPATLTKKLKLLSELELIVADRTHDRLRVYYSLHRHSKSLKKFLDSFERLSGELL